MSVFSKMTAIADNIRKKTGKTEKLGLDDIVSGVDDVYDAGIKSEYDKFWDKFQNYGQRTMYNRASGANFATYGWSFKNFYPKYDLTFDDGSNMFYDWNDHSGDEYIGDFAQRLQDCNVKIFPVYTGNAYGLFYACSGFTRLPELDLSEASNVKTLCYGCTRLKTIDKVIFGEKITSTASTFQFCSALENVVFDGVLAIDLDIHWSTKLTHDSIMSLLNILKDFSGSGTTRTLTLGTSNLAKLTDTEKTIATGKGWTLA